MKFLSVFLLFLGLFCGSVFADINKQLYLEAVSHDGNMEKALKAEEAFLKLEGELPAFYNRVRLATLLALKAKFSTLKKIHFVNKSIDAFDELAKEISPTSNIVDKYELHLFRGRTFSQFPAIFGKKEIAKEDIKTAIQILENNELNREDGEVARLFLSYAIILDSEGGKENSREFARKAISLDGLDAKDMETAKKLL
jgi:tetratricopeptide (TPR) repeat protein